MKFYLKVHSIIGGAPGEPGFGGVPGGDVGFGGGSSGPGFGFLEGAGYGFGAGSLFGNPATAIIGAMIGGLASQAQGDPGGGYSGTGGGPTDFLARPTMVQKALTAPIPQAPAKTPVIPAPAAKRKRVGRQETILTSGLSDTPTFKPTLLGQ